MYIAAYAYKTEEEYAQFQEAYVAQSLLLKVNEPTSLSGHQSSTVYLIITIVEDSGFLMLEIYAGTG